MRLNNTTTHDIELNYLITHPTYDEQKRTVVPAQGFVVDNIIQVDYIQQSASSIAFFTSGQLVIKNNDNSAWSGEAIGAAVQLPAYRRIRSADGGITLLVNTSAYGGDIPNLSNLDLANFPLKAVVIVGDNTYASSDLYLPELGFESGRVVHVQVLGDSAAVGVGGDGNNSTIQNSQGQQYISQLYNVQSGGQEFGNKLVWSITGAAYILTP